MHGRWWGTPTGVLVLAGLLAVRVFAQERRPGPDGGERRPPVEQIVNLRLQMLERQVGPLSEEQKTKAREILGKEQAELQPLYQKLREVQAATRAEMEKVLTPEQLAKLRAPATWLSLEERAKLRVEGASRALNLTDEQKAQALKVFTKEQTDLEALEKDTTLSREARRARSEEVRKAAIDALTSFLTPEQQEKLQQTP